MDMDNSRRSFDRMGKLGMKKPRLHYELEFDTNQSVRPFPQRQVTSGVNTLASARFRTNDRDPGSNDSGLGPQQLLHQELVTQYKAALAELTFNSKPIITNLTIIADENVYAAKAIVATVCSNILEVPSEQKLPSLYLLDSIVKNIGREYIKHFAARLPEVFCKAYRQVDSSVHSSMRHLFGTWKRVFPLQALEMIEKELGFTPVANGLSSPSPSTMLKSDSQPQRPSHGIHVNPKYLERQRLQQSSRAIGTTNDMTGTIASSTEDTDRLDRAMVTSRPWADPRLKMRNIKPANRDAFDDYLPEKSIGISYEGNGQGSTLSSNMGLGIGGTGGRATDFGRDKIWYKSGKDIGEISGQGNGLSLKHSVSTHEATKSLNLDAHQPPTQSLSEISIRSSVISRSWKNSEEEEFLWDNMDSGVTDNTASSVSSDLAKDHWTADDEGLDPPLSRQLQGRHLLDELNCKPDPMEGFASTAGMRGQHKFHTVQAETPLREQSLQEKMCQPYHERNLTEQHHQQTLKASHFSGDLQGKYIQDSSAAHSSNIQAGKLQKSQQRDWQGPAPLLTYSQPRHYTGVLPKQQPGSSLPEVSVKIEELDQSKVSLVSEPPDQSTSSGLLAAVMKSGILNSSAMNNLLSTSFLDTRVLPLQSGNQPTQLGGPQGEAASPSSFGTSSDNSSHLTKISQRKVGQLPRASDPPPASSAVCSTSSQTSNPINASSPISNLLSSLVAKGLICAKSESSIKAPTDMLSRLEDTSHSISTSSSSPVGSGSGSPAVHVSSIGDEVDHEANSSVYLSKSTATETINLIGYEFKPDVIRQFHPSVISELWDDLPHHCSICGLRLRHQEQFNGHLVWHAMRGKEQNGLIQASRRWYVQSSEWITGKVEYSTESESTNSVDVYCEEADKSELDTMVPSDENQCLCVFCGELFEDVYCQERDEWMFKGATYLTNSDNDVETASRNVITARGLIIHAKCLSKTSIISVPKMEQV
ncbi:hypothetical protein QN277_021285 [Acacia crassicarpa]|uniref:CID domain-containing protein n=1 Tax=Acacia crassicarpa TaxID=499986 RepID=A0AAE1JNG7_9FABA|nr:hypothetical protein QN277_021285 [Acacia crassicarpa]